MAALQSQLEQAEAALAEASLASSLATPAAREEDSEALHELEEANAALWQAVEKERSNAAQSDAKQKLLQAVLLARLRKAGSKFATALEEARVDAESVSAEQRASAEAAIGQLEADLSAVRAEAAALAKANELLEAELAGLVDGAVLGSGDGPGGGGVGGVGSGELGGGGGTVLSAAENERVAAELHAERQVAAEAAAALAEAQQRQVELEFDLERRSAQLGAAKAATDKAKAAREAAEAKAKQLGDEVARLSAELEAARLHAARAAQQLGRVREAGGGASLDDLGPLPDLPPPPPQIDPAELAKLEESAKQGEVSQQQLQTIRPQIGELRGAITALLGLVAIETGGGVSSKETPSVLRTAPSASEPSDLEPVMAVSGDCVDCVVTVLIALIAVLAVLAPKLSIWSP